MYISIQTITKWPAANYINPERHAPTLYIVHGVLYPIVLLMLGIRIYTRKYISEAMGLDDYLILTSIIPTTAFAILSILIEKSAGWDVHQWDAPLSTITLGLKYTFTTEVVFAVGVTLIRLSMLSLIYRLFTNGAVRLQRFTIGFMIYMGIHGFIFTTTLIFQCRPVHAYWKLSFTPQGNCINETLHLLITSIFNSVSDFLVVLLPIPTVWNLQMPSRQKAIVSLLFLMGFFTSTASIIRIVYLYEATSGSDRTWATYSVFVWSSVELYLGILCACIPPSTGFFKRFFPKLLNSLHQSSKPENKSCTSNSQSSRNMNNGIELADTDDDERGIMPQHNLDDGVATTDFRTYKSEYQLKSALL